MKETGKFEPRILVLTCNWCSYAGADLAGVSRMQYPTNVRLMRVMCSGRVTPAMLLYAFEKGIDGVIYSGCHIGDCHYISGNEKAIKVYEKTKRLMEALGLDPRRLRQEWVSAAEGERFAGIMTDFTEELKKLGPNPIGEIKAKAQ
ncbi:methyl-viologen-reducing hydrogenase subunit delta [candidate division TA06 bacterium DG_26]|uniref:Methyl-viologen-reducing hydrogenase subunit delta n=1 Tax=candidate division TA06 bacterium DG_26 TaxID=1703771 RepID=A0A0S7WFQ2_UNCT6|nr:MAG: methyl-viologen-reducing hydrogenase subunit delta [candidate division TA06 bacterium DG_26]